MCFQIFQNRDCTDVLPVLPKSHIDFILVPKSHGIHEPSALELLGCVTENGYVWDEAVVKKAFSDAKMIELKKAVLNKAPRK